MTDKKKSPSRIGTVREDIQKAIEAAQDSGGFTGTLPEIQVDTAVDFLFHLRYGIGNSQFSTAYNTEKTAGEGLSYWVSADKKFVFSLWHYPRRLIFFIDPEGIIDIEAYEGSKHKPFDPYNPPMFDELMQWLENEKQQIDKTICVEVEIKNVYVTKGYLASYTNGRKYFLCEWTHSHKMGNETCRRFFTLEWVKMAKYAGWFVPLNKIGLSQAPILNLLDDLYNQVAEQYPDLFDSVPLLSEDAFCNIIAPTPDTI